ncbi:P2 family phage major capsid protein [Glaesserella parasuis]|uniref:P2 family phage major capsid protein n=2 Tax=Glaesserella parasuis TaxID=738 RepID=UPI002437442F|nr:P2 family phage major capsid protein [Glaesserella parasuis]MDG6266255.1 P2 family phage major capsid protein [Glaesserella parasuis]MDP0233104.1 P2 family phage major capsid protein [Glaesserella parasuis]
MRPETATKFSTYLAGVAQDNSVDYNHIFTGKKFTVEPSVQQRLEKQVQESSAFLQLINIVPVIEAKGETDVASMVGGLWRVSPCFTNCRLRHSSRPDIA